MSYLLILRHIKVENANAIAGLTYGFPAISHFLGYTHALSRKLQKSHNLTLNGCGVICHKQQIHAYQTGWDRIFALTRNPLTKEANTAAFNEEGRMHMTVSLLIECTGTIPDGDEGAKALSEHLKSVCVNQKLAGGSIVDIRKIDVVAFPQDEQQTRNLMRRLLPGYVLLDRKDLLKTHYGELKQDNRQAEIIDAWLDFSAIKMKAAMVEKEDGSQVNWDYIPKPAPGFLVPLTTGYRAISQLYDAGQVEKARDPHTPFCFVESIYSVGEWRGVHRIKDIEQVFWRYDYHADWYQCRSSTPTPNETYVFNDDDD
jgi:CRISPR-associated protein Csy2